MIKHSIFAERLTPENAAMINELSGIIEITSYKRIARGHENKYCIITKTAEKFLLRINDTEHYEWLEGDFRMYAYVANAGINIMKPVVMGKFHGGELAQQLYTWLDGEDLSGALPCMSKREQFVTGLKAGRLMRELHALPPMNKPEPWEVRFGRKVDKAIGFVTSHSNSARYGLELADYLNEHSGLWTNRPLCFTHGDWNPENLMLLNDGSVAIIDLSGENDYGDPWWEFGDMLCVEDPPAEYLTGRIKGYFQGEPPKAFFELLPCYITYMALEYLEYKEDDDKNDDTEHVMRWFDNMRKSIPSWYMSELQE